jgi:hypothetical protein
VNLPILEMRCEIAIETPENVSEERTGFTSLCHQSKRSGGHAAEMVIRWGKEGQTMGARRARRCRCMDVVDTESLEQQLASRWVRVSELDRKIRTI